MGRERTTAAGSGAALVVYGANAVLELLRSGGPLTRLCLAPGPRERELTTAARARGVRAETVDRATLTRVAGSPHHQGAVAMTPRFRYAPLDDLLVAGCGSALVLDGIQDPRNLGSIVRTARAFGVAGIVLARD